MNFFQRKAKKNLINFIKDDIVDIYVIPNKRNRLYKRKDGRLISHRALMKVIRGLMKEKSRHRICPLCYEEEVPNNNATDGLCVNCYNANKYEENLPDPDLSLMEDNFMYAKGDFHIHSTNSDGKYDVKSLIDRYIDKEFDIIAITDHDTMEGCKEAIEYGKTKGFKVVPGIEISTKYNGEDIHILGYFKEEDCRRDEMIEFAKVKQQDRIDRCKKIVSSLKKYFNIEISADELLEKTEGMIGRPHMARAIISAGYATTMEEVFTKYLDDNSPAFIPSSFLTPQEGIDLLRRNNATVVLAHPILIKNTKIEDLLNTFKFDGIEAIYGLNSEADTKAFISICKERDLLITAGSDFHDYNTSNHCNIGDISLGIDSIDKLLKTL
jgi:Predicted metal-dependent phosphoesterases (PHP family)